MYIARSRKKEWVCVDLAWQLPRGEGNKKNKRRKNRANLRTFEWPERPACPTLAKTDLATRQEARNGSWRRRRRRKKQGPLVVEGQLKARGNAFELGSGIEFEKVDESVSSSPSQDS